MDQKVYKNKWANCIRPFSDRGGYDYGKRQLFRGFLFCGDRRNYGDELCNIIGAKIEIPA